MLEYKKGKEPLLELLLLIGLIIIYYLQCKLRFDHIDFSKNNMLSILSFSVSILTLYGIYIAFLQFLIENNKGFYLGVSRIKFLVDNSILVQCTKRKMFFIMLLSMIGIPIIRNRYNFMSISMEYLWQACCFIVLIIYILLLEFTFKMVFNLFNTKSSNDFKISNEIQNDFKTEFVKAYKKGIQPELVEVKLSAYINKMKSEEIDKFLSEIYSFSINENSLSNYINSHISEIKSDVEKAKKFYEFYEKYCRYKWKCLKEYKNHISYKVWKDLVNEDIWIFYNLINDNECLLELDEKRNNNFVQTDNTDTIIQFLNEVLLEQLEKSKIADLEEKDTSIIIDALREYSHDNSILKRGTKKYMESSSKYRLEIIIKKYKRGNKYIGLPQPKCRYLNEDEAKFYSKTCFEHLTSIYLDDFKKNEKIKDLILSMNIEYQLGFMLYKILYQMDRRSYKDIEFYDENISYIILNYSGDYDDLFKEVSKIVVKTDIKHIFTEDLLNELWKKKTEEINNFSWFNQYKTTRMSEFQVIYIQNLLNNLPEKYRSRFNFTNKSNGKDNIYFCKEYFKLIAKYPSLVSLKKYGNTLQTSVAYLLVNDIDDLSEIVTESPVRTLLHLEKLLKNSYFIFRDYMIKSTLYYNNKMFLRHKTMKEEDLLCYSGICEFYLLKVSDESYRQVYRPNFNNALKNSIINTLRNKDLTLLEYLDSIINELPEDLKVSKYEKDRIFLIINEWVSKIEVENFNSSYKKFNHKRKIRMTKV